METMRAVVALRHPGPRPKKGNGRRQQRRALSAACSDRPAVLPCYSRLPAFRAFSAFWLLALEPLGGPRHAGVFLSMARQIFSLAYLLARGESVSPRSEQPNASLRCLLSLLGMLGPQCAPAVLKTRSMNGRKKASTAQTANLAPVSRMR